MNTKGLRATKHYWISDWWDNCATKSLTKILTVFEMWKLIKGSAVIINSFKEYVMQRVVLSNESTYTGNEYRTRQWVEN